MPQRKSGLDELKKNHKRHMRNLDAKTDLKKTVKAFMKSVEGKKPDEAKDGLRKVYKKLDKAAKNNILSKNTAARRKSRFTKLLTSIASK